MQTIYEASILLVDDNPDLLVLVGDSLRTAGYTCIRTAATCAEARALFAAAAPELMILDINLPDGDGFTLLRQLHAKADVPAVVCQLLQQGALGGGQRQGHAVGAVHGSIGQIDLAVPQLQGRRGGAAQFGPVGALQNTLHP